MDKLIQFATKSSFYDGPFGGGHPWIAAGMGYLLSVEGTLLAIDGGKPEDAEAFVSLIEKYSHGEAKVHTWILTHPHIDHFGVLHEISTDEKLRSRVKIGRVVCLFDERLCHESAKDALIPAKTVLPDILSATGAEHVTPEENLVITCGEMSVKFLFVPREKGAFYGPNHMSVIFKVKTPSREILFTGDAPPPSLEEALRKHADELRCDVIQLPHHGLCDSGDEDFYRAAGAKVVMIPTCVSGEARMTDGTHGITPAHFAKDLAKRVYKAFEGTCEID